MCWNEWKINFLMFSFWVMVDFILKIYRKLANFEYNIDHISKTKSRQNWFFIRFSTFRIFHVNMNTLFSWNVLNRIQINTKNKYFIIVHISTWSVWNMGRFRWTQSWYILAGIEERHTRSSSSTALSLSVFSCFFYRSQTKAHLT